jgi:hypothetical protein
MKPKHTDQSTELKTKPDFRSAAESKRAPKAGVDGEAVAKAKREQTFNFKGGKYVQNN